MLLVLETCFLNFMSIFVLFLTVQSNARTRALESARPGLESGATTYCVTQSKLLNLSGPGGCFPLGK